MAKTFKSFDKPSKNRFLGIILGLFFCFLLFLAIPLTQLFVEYEKSEDNINALEIAPPPPPPPPPEDPPPPPEPEEEEPPPELETTPPPISLEQLDMALEPGYGDAAFGDFSLPQFDAKTADLGMDIFDIGDLDKIPSPRRTLIPPRYPQKLLRMGIEGYVIAEFIVNKSGDVESVEIIKSTDSGFEPSTIESIRKWKFNPGEKDGEVVRCRMRQKFPFTIN